MQPIVALIGRPNVGKSTLFNRLIGKNRAITHDRPGVTRDRMYGEVRRGGMPFTLVDTGGIALDAKGEAAQGPAELRGFEKEVLAQAREAMAEAMVVLLVMDARDGLLPVDEELARHARESGKPLLVVLNKIDGEEQEVRLMGEFHALGLELIPVSSAHGYNVQGLLDRVREFFPEPEVEPEPETEPEETLGSDEQAADWEGPPYNDEAELPAQDEDTELRTDQVADDDGTGLPPGIGYVLPEPDPRGLRLAMLGRPNAGKSSLVNRLAGAERMIVSEKAGTTRDSVDVTVTRPDGRGYVFVDTAGVRKRAKVRDTVERFSVQAALKSSRMAHVTILVLDATQGVGVQDKKLIAYLDKEKIPFITVVNKFDLVQGRDRKGVMRSYQDALSICKHVPVVYASALTGRNVEALLDQAEAVWKECGLRVSTGLLNRAVREVVQRHQPPVVKGVRAKFYYLTQAKVMPPSFVMFVNDPDRVKESYKRYLENQLRKLFGMKTAPLRLLFRGSHEKKAEKAGR